MRPPAWTAQMIRNETRQRESCRKRAVLLACRTHRRGACGDLDRLGAGKPWGKSAVIWTIAAVLALLIVYELAYVLLRRRIAAWTAQGEYPKALALAVRLSKWYYGGRNASAHHAAAANILFQMEEDERFRQETEQITAPRFLFLKYAFRTLGCLVNRDVSAAREALQRFWAERPRGTWKEQGSRLTAFLNVIDPSCPEDRGPLIASLLRTTPNRRVRKFLLEEQSRLAAASSTEILPTPAPCCTGIWRAEEFIFS